MKRFRVSSNQSESASSTCFSVICWQGTISPQLLSASSFSVDGDLLRASGAGRIALQNWRVRSDSALEVHATYSAPNVPALLSRLLGSRTPVTHGVATGAVNVTGSLLNPGGRVHVTVQDLVAYGEQVNRLQADAFVNGAETRIERAQLQPAEGGRLGFSGVYTRTSRDWRNGRLSAHAQSGDLPVSSFHFLRNLAPGLNGRAAIDARLSAEIRNAVLHPTQLNGQITLASLSAGDLSLGMIHAQVTTANQKLHCSLQGDLRDSNFHGEATVGLSDTYPVDGRLRFDHMSLTTLNEMARPSQNLPAHGYLAGAVDFGGPLSNAALWHSAVHVDQLQISSLASSPGFELHNASPIELDLSDGAARIRSFELSGTDTRLSISGSAGYRQPRPLALAAKGSIDLRLLRAFDPNLEPSGRSVLQASITGTLASPSVLGRLEFNSAGFSLNNFPNGLRAVTGAVTFTGNRATIEHLTAVSGGGQLRIGGFVTFGGATPAAYHLNAQADNVRLSYSNISITANTDLRLTGTSSSSLLSGTATVSRAVFNANTDVGNVLSGFAAPVPTPANRRDFLSALHLDVHIQSAPNLQLSTSLSRDVEADIDLRLRGTSDRPTLLGSISANQGDIRVFGTRYSINRGVVNFVNPNRIDPVLDLDLQTQTRGVTVDITISGTLNRLNIAYRSDPPLQPRDIVALLTVGRAPQEASSVQNQTNPATADTTALQSSASSAIGQAISPSSGRLSKLFGVTNIRLDPLVQGVNVTTQSRLTIEQQVSRAITVTYVTNLEQTSEQIFRLEWAINPQYSVVAVRDDNGEFGIDIQYKRRFK